MRYRLRTLLIVAALLPVPLAVLSANFLTLPLRDSDKVDVARSLIAWVVENRPVPGFDEPVADGQWIRNRKSLVVACDFVPASTHLSDDPRVRLVTRQEFDQSLRENHLLRPLTLLENQPLKKRDFTSTAFIELELKSESPRLLVFEVSNDYAPDGTQCYRFEFRRKVWGLRGWGKLLYLY
jgi:hypothetical protein